VSGSLPLFRRDKSFILEKVSLRRLVTAALATVIALGVLAIVISFRSEIVFHTASAGLEERATKVITQFFEELNAGLGDSSPFAARPRTFAAGEKYRANLLGNSLAFRNHSPVAYPLQIPELFDAYRYVPGGG
jgi:hypothetical protein